jgi:hypothetical protein
MIESRSNPNWILIVGLVGKIVFNVFCFKKVFLEVVKNSKCESFSLNVRGVSLFMNQGALPSNIICQFNGYWWGKTLVGETI